MAKIELPKMIIPNLARAGIPARVTAINISAGSAEVTITPSMEYGEIIQPIGERPRRTRGRGRQIKGYPRAVRTNYTRKEHIQLIEKVKELVHSHDRWPTEQSSGKKRGIKFKSSDDKHRLVFQVV